MPYLGEIRMFAGNFAPVGWMLCQGQTLAIAENDALFNLIGTTYGGDGQETFNLPDLQGRVPVHQGQGSGLQSYVIGERGGVEEVTLTVQQTPVHNHGFVATTNPGTSSNPTGNLLSSSPSANMFIEGTSPDSALASPSVQPAGGSQPHDNRMPYLAINYIIATNGVYPHT